MSTFDEYALFVDKMFEEMGDLKGKVPEKLGMMDKIKLVKIVSGASLKLAESAGKWAEFMETHIDMSEELNEEERIAFESVFLSILKIRWLKLMKNIRISLIKTIKFCS